MPKIHTTIGLRVSFFLCERLLFTVSRLLQKNVLLDYEGLNDRLTSTAQTPRSADFRDDVARRDGHTCAISQVAEEHCDAAHLIPRSKGEQVRFVVSI